VEWVKVRNAVPIKALREALMSRHRRPQIEGGTFFYTLALADRGGDATELSERFGE
jgi:tRNA A37 N6-isopentenylltransferase MiaA